LLEEEREREREGERKSKREWVDRVRTKERGEVEREKINLKCDNLFIYFSVSFALALPSYHSPPPSEPVSNYIYSLWPGRQSLSISQAREREQERESRREIGEIENFFLKWYINLFTHLYTYLSLSRERESERKLEKEREERKREI
jgi:hypothetical protein